MHGHRMLLQSTLCLAFTKYGIHPLNSWCHRPPQTSTSQIVGGKNGIRGARQSDYSRGTNYCIVALTPGARLTTVSPPSQSQSVSHQAVHCLKNSATSLFYQNPWREEPSGGESTMILYASALLSPVKIIFLFFFNTSHTADILILSYE